MTRLELFLKAMDANLFEELAWLISFFSLTMEEEDDWKLNPYLYRLVRNKNGHFYVNENKELIPITDTNKETRIAEFTDVVELKAGALVNLQTDIETTFGNILFNHLCLCKAFGSKIPYIEGDVDIGVIEDTLLKNFNSIPDSQALRDPKAFYVDEYLKLCQSVNYMTGVSNISNWAYTPKSIVGAPGIDELRETLLKKHAKELHIPSVIVDIEQKIVNYDKDYLKDDPSRNFLLGGKAFDTIRKRKYGTFGLEPGLESDPSKARFISKPLKYGLDMKQFPHLNDITRAGSYKRGAETQIGGEEVKWLLRAAGNMNVTVSDCGSVLGFTELITKSNLKDLYGGTILLDGTSHHIGLSGEGADAYLGKVVVFRSPMYCKLTMSDYCQTCLGDVLGSNKNGLPLAVSKFGTTIMLDSMSAMHTKKLETQFLDYVNLIN